MEYIDKHLYGHIALDTSSMDEGFGPDENLFIIENFFWFADEVFSTPKEVV